METKEHGYLTIKGLIDSEPETMYSTNGDLIWRCKLWAINNEIYHCMAIKNNAEAYQKKYFEGMYVEIKGKHQTSTWSEDTKEELVFCQIKKWNPEYKDVGRKVKFIEKKLQK